ncbi:MAG TPA: NINE protein, partial [Ktedonobacterales bacterium]|nr:NINE protein [Ktedonobacterales bacterium]
MSVDITQLSAHLAPALQEEVTKSYKQQAKSDTTAFLLTFFLGLLGAHRFYLNQWFSGIAHLALTAAGVIVLVAGIVNQGASQFSLVITGAALLLLGLLWEAVDLFVIDRQVHASNLALAERLIVAAQLTDDTPEKQALAKLDELTHATVAPAAGAGVITAAEVANARAMAEESSSIGETSAHYASMSRMEISDSPAERHHEAEVRAGEASVTGEPAASEALSDQAETEGVAQPVAEQTQEETSVVAEVLPAAAAGGLAAGAAGETLVELERRTHEESGDRATDSVETETYAIPEAPATPESSAEPAADVSAPEITTEAEPAEAIPSTEVGEPSPTMEEAVTTEPVASEPTAVEAATLAGAAAATEAEAEPSVSGLNLVSPDLTDAHPGNIESAPVADIAPEGSAVRVALPAAEQSAPEPDVAAEELLASEGASTPSVAPEPQEYVPPTVAAAMANPADTLAEPAASEPTATEVAGSAGVAALAGAGAVAATEAEAPAPAAETPAAPAMKRVRAVRHVVVDGKVVSEVSAEEIVPVDTDSA